MDDVQKGLQNRYSHLHPLLFLRSLEKSNSNVELFDILETVPAEYPVFWCDEDRCWKHTDDLLQGANVVKENAQ